MDSHETIGAALLEPVPVGGTTRVTQSNALEPLIALLKAAENGTCSWGLQG